MIVTKEILVDLNEKFHKILKLIFEDSKFDPESEPYKSKYAAQNILHGMKASIEGLLSKIGEESALNLKLTGMLGCVYLYLGIVAIDTDEPALGKSYLSQCEKVTKPQYNAPELVLITLNLYNQYGILFANTEEQTAKLYLEQAEALYLDFKTKGAPPLDLTEIFQVNPEERNEDMAWKNYEKTYTFTLYYLAQIYGTLKNLLKSSFYCHVTLKRQLASGDYDPIEWSLNAATLSQFFMEKNGFKQARHHLAASSCVLAQHEAKLGEVQDRDAAYDAKMEVFKHRSADVSRCWAKYGLFLLEKSKERLLSHTDDIDAVCTITTDLSGVSLDGTSLTQDDLNNLEFSSLELFQYESQITYNFLLTIQDARLVFLNVQAWLQKASRYYTLDSFASDHIEIVQDQSRMYENLLFFEESVETQAKLHKRRIDMYEDLLNKINPKYYLQFCREIWYDVAQAYAEILNIKSDKLQESAERPSPHSLTKINSLVEKSIGHFKSFLGSFKEVAGGVITGVIVEEYEKVVVQAFFHIGALHSRFITLDKAIQLHNTEESLRAYKAVVEYCREHEKTKELIKMEFGICEEMVSLLPVKIRKLRHELEG